MLVELLSANALPILGAESRTEQAASQVPSFVYVIGLRCRSMFLVFARAASTTVRRSEDFGRATPLACRCKDFSRCRLAAEIPGSRNRGSLYCLHGAMPRNKGVHDEINSGNGRTTSGSLWRSAVRNGPTSEFKFENSRRHLCQRG